MKKIVEFTIMAMFLVGIIKGLKSLCIDKEFEEDGKEPYDAEV